jgi:outer membrane protein OmpA-like peptidoglycan-associated protein
VLAGFLTDNLGIEAGGRMATENSSHSTVEEREDDRLLDIWLFTLFALGVLIFVLFAAPRGCETALQEKANRPIAATLPNGVTLSLPRDSLNYHLVRFLGSKDDVEVPRTFVFDRLNFTFGTTQLTTESLPTLRDLAAILKAYPSVEVRLDGHTDNVGDAAANQRLSLERAESVKALLVKSGIAAKRISTAGYGQDKPIAPNTTDAGKAKNRRLELVVLKK